MNAPYSGIQRLAELWLIDEQGRRERYLVIFKVFNGYMDETGTHHPSDVVGIAGYLSTYDDWIRFMSEWDQAMRLYCIEDFHMNEFENHWGEFADNRYWTPDIRTRVIERVCQICQQNTVLGLGCAISREHYERVLPPSIQGDLRDPYYYCLYGCMSMLLACKEDTRIATIKPVNFLFDHKPGRFKLGATMVGWQAFATEFYNRVQSALDENGEVLGALTFGTRQVYSPIRAADLLVYETGKLQRQRLYEPWRPLRKSMRALRKRSNLIISFQTEVRLRNFVRFLEGYRAGMSANQISAKPRDIRS